MLDELDKERKGYRKTSQKLDDANEIIIRLKVKVEEVRNIRILKNNSLPKLSIVANWKQRFQG